MSDEVIDVYADIMSNHDDHDIQSIATSKSSNQPEAKIAELSPSNHSSSTKSKRKEQTHLSNINSVSTLQEEEDSNLLLFGGVKPSPSQSISNISDTYHYIVTTPANVNENLISPQSDVSNGPTTPPTNRINADASGAQSYALGSSQNSSGQGAAINISEMTWWTTEADIISISHTLSIPPPINITFFDHKNNGKSKGMALVEYADTNTAMAVIDYLDKHELHGRKVIVQFATGTRGTRVFYERNKSAHMGSSTSASSVSNGSGGGSISSQLHIPGSATAAHPFPPPPSSSYRPSSTISTNFPGMLPPPPLPPAMLMMGNLPIPPPPSFLNMPKYDTTTPSPDEKSAHTEAIAESPESLSSVKNVAAPLPSNFPLPLPPPPPPSSVYPPQGVGAGVNYFSTPYPSSMDPYYRSSYGMMNPMMMGQPFPSPPQGYFPHHPSGSAGASNDTRKTEERSDRSREPSRSSREDRSPTRGSVKRSSRDERRSHRSSRSRSPVTDRRGAAPTSSSSSVSRHSRHYDRRSRSRDRHAHSSEHLATSSSSSSSHGPLSGVSTGGSSFSSSTTSSSYGKGGREKDKYEHDGNTHRDRTREHDRDSNRERPREIRQPTERSSNSKDFKQQQQQHYESSYSGKPVSGRPSTITNSNSNISTSNRGGGPMQEERSHRRRR